MGKTQDMAHIDRFISGREEEDLYIHAYPCDLAFYSVLDATGQGSTDEEEVMTYLMLFLDRKSLSRFKRFGKSSFDAKDDKSAFEVKRVNIKKKKGHELGERGRVFLDLLSETGLFIQINGSIYGVSRSALAKMHLQAEMTGGYDRSCIHDIMLAERLLAMSQSFGTSGSVERIDLHNAKGYTFAVSRSGSMCREGSFIKGIITGMYSGWYEGMEKGSMRKLCDYILDGSWQDGGSVRLSGCRVSRERIEMEFTAGTPVRYLADGKEHIMEKCISFADTSSGYGAFVLSGFLKDPDTGDTVIIHSEKHNHYGKAGGPCGNPVSMKTVGEKKLPLIWRQMEEFSDVITGCIKNDVPGTFVADAMSGKMRECVGKKRAAILVEKASSMDGAGQVHVLLHMKSLLRDMPGLKPLPLDNERSLQRFTAKAIKTAAAGRKDK